MVEIRKRSKYIIVDELTGKSIDDKQYSYTPAKLCRSYYQRLYHIRSLKIVKIQ